MAPQSAVLAEREAVEKQKKRSDGAPSGEVLKRSMGPLPASCKVYKPGALHKDMRVPMREIALTPTK